MDPYATAVARRAALDHEGQRRGNPADLEDQLDPDDLLISACAAPARTDAFQGIVGGWPSRKLAWPVRNAAPSTGSREFFYR